MLLHINCCDSSLYIFYISIYSAPWYPMSIFTLHNISLHLLLLIYSLLTRNYLSHLSSFPLRYWTDEVFILLHFYFLFLPSIPTISFQTISLRIYSAQFFLVPTILKSVFRVLFTLFVQNLNPPQILYLKTSWELLFINGEGLVIITSNINEWEITDEGLKHVKILSLVTHYMFIYICLVMLPCV